MKFPQSSSFCLSSFMTDLEIITSVPFTVPCIDLAQGIETHQKTRQGGMAKLLCGNPSCGRKAFFWFSLKAMLPPPNNRCMLSDSSLFFIIFFFYTLFSVHDFICCWYRKAFVTYFTLCPEYTVQMFNLGIIMFVLMFEYVCFLFLCALKVFAILVSDFLTSFILQSIKFFSLHSGDE